MALGYVYSVTPVCGWADTPCHAKQKRPAGRFFPVVEGDLGSGGDKMKRLFENASSTRHTQFTGAFITS